MKTDKQGAHSEAAVIKELSALGHAVSVPLSDVPYDLVVEIDGEMMKVQVKTGRLQQEGSVIVAKLERTSGTGSHRADVYSRAEIDAFAIYCPDLDQVYWVRFEEAPSKKIHLRIKSKQPSDPTIRWAEEYELERAILR